MANSLGGAAKDMSGAIGDIGEALEEVIKVPTDILNTTTDVVKDTKNLVSGAVSMVSLGGKPGEIAASVPVVPIFDVKKWGATLGEQVVRRAANAPRIQLGQKSLDFVANFKKYMGYAYNPKVGTAEIDELRRRMGKA